MMQTPQIYQFHAWLRGISPLIWRRLLVRSDQTVADLHYALQLAFDWSDSHLNIFRIHGKDFGVYRLGGPVFDEDAKKVRLADFHFRIGERFLYEYDFGDHWEHQIRLERSLPFMPEHTYPVCIGGKRSAPPEDCGGVWAFQQRRDEAPWRGQELLDQITECVRERDITALRDLAEEIPAIQTWLTLHKVDRRKVNRRLRQYAVGNAEWRSPQGGTE
jgi:Plasmid pRiA4b ORF-3-like protein